MYLAYSYYVYDIFSFDFSISNKILVSSKSSEMKLLSRFVDSVVRHFSIDRTTKILVGLMKFVMKREHKYSIVTIRILLKSTKFLLDLNNIPLTSNSLSGSFIHD